MPDPVEEIEEGQEEGQEEEGEKWVDPGQLEGEVKKDPVKEQDKLTPEHPRFKEVYAKLKETERKLAEIEENGSQKNTILEEMRNWNQRLAEALEKKDESTSDSNSKEAELKAELKTLQEKYKGALLVADYDEAAELTDKITDLKLDLRELKSSKQVEKKVEQKQVPEATPEDIAISSFIQSTKWFQADPEMRAYAKMLDIELAKDPKYKDKIESRLNEVKKRTEDRFGWNNNTNRERGSGVEGRGEEGSGLKGTKLSSIELEIARGLGLSPEAIIKQKQFTEKKGGRRNG